VIAVAAVDLREGHAVQLVGGRPEEQRVGLPDAAAVAREWEEAGFPALHVIDLDAALGRGDNRRAIEAIVGSAGVPVQVGGGVRDDAAADSLLFLGAARIIVGTRAVEDREWLESLCARHPHRVIVAADMRNGEIVTRGWTHAAGLDAARFITSLDVLPLAGVLVTDVSREGRMVGADAERFAELVQATRHPLQAAGGIGGIDDLRNLDAAGVAATVLGMSLYTGAVRAEEVVREFGG
jgi:phosphoribosylformimino-5-aminoimidazole carboxamide ribotide isomerase